MPEPPPSSHRRSPIEGPEDASKPEGRAQPHRAFSRRCFPCLRAEEPLGPAAPRTRLKPSPRPAAGSGGPAGARQGSAAGAGTNTALASGTAGPPRHRPPPPRPTMLPPSGPEERTKGRGEGTPPAGPSLTSGPGDCWLPSVGARTAKRGGGGGSSGGSPLVPGSAAMSGAGVAAELARPRACSGGGEGAGAGAGAGSGRCRLCDGGGWRGWRWPRSPLAACFT